jgi:hypothetical protein
MLSEPGNAVLVLAQIAFKPEIAYQVKLSGAASAVHGILKTEHWTIAGGGNTAILHEAARRTAMFITYKHVQTQALGFDAWHEQLEENVRAASVALERMEVATAIRVSVQFQCFLDLRMSHSELCDALFGSYFAPREGMRLVFPGMYDVLGKFYGRQDHEFDFEVGIVPQTQEEATNSFFGWPNLDLFNDSRKTQNSPADFWQHRARPCLNLEVSLSKKDVSAQESARFWTSASGRAEQLAERVVNHLKSLPVK